MKVLSGGALGADSVWSYIAENNGVSKEDIIHYIAPGMKRPQGNQERKIEQSTGTEYHLTNEELEVGIQDMIKRGITISKKKAKEYFFNTNGYSPIQKLQGRNYYQVVNSDQVLAVVALINNSVSGGTATAISLAIDLGKPVYVLNTVDAEWYTYKNGKYIRCEVPKPREVNTCIGTRSLVKYNVCKYGHWVPAPYVGEELEDKLRNQMEKVFHDI